MTSLIASSFPLHLHPASLQDVILGFAAQYLVILALVPPPTQTWRYIRASIIAPLASFGFLYCGIYPAKKCWEDQWGTNTLMAYFSLRAFELLLFFPAEDYNYRVRPTANDIKLSLPPKTRGALNGSASAKTHTHEGFTTQVEPIPPAWTWEKFWWASSLWWSWRGIGWNYAAPLPTSSQKDPFIPNSSRWKYVRRRLTHYAIGWIIQDFVRAYMNASPAAPFFSARPGAPAYSDLTQWQRGVYSTCMAVRICLGMERSHVPASILFVGIGGIMGWEGEIWSPWGWPPLFGGFKDIWTHPGLSHMWSRTWHQYFRRWLYLYGWIGIGENILRLPHSGAASRSSPPSSSTNGLSVPSPTITPGITPTTSGRTSPTHPLPTTASSRTRFPVQLSNLLKSICVFALTGWIHDHSSYFNMIHINPKLHSDGWRWTDAIITTPFFVAQPFALAVEAAIKKTWRKWKKVHHSDWATQGEPAWLVFLERLIGFVWTWTWLGWTAGWFVEGLTHAGVYLREGETEYPSLFGGLLWNRWMH